MQRKWRREWEHRKEGQLAARSTNYGREVLKTLTRTILPPVAAATMLLSSMIMPAYANPTGGQITAGTGSIAQTGNTMNITQNTNKLSINWQSFNIAKNETVNFQQPGASAIALNRVVGNNASSIYGHLNANGQVFLINTNGVLFAPGSAVNVGGIVASTLNISDSDFQTGNYKFSGNGGSVVNQGAITAANGGYVALLGNQVANQGVVVANQGTVALGAGNAVTLDFAGDGLYSLAVTESALNAQASNQNLIQADGGQVYMTARAANALAGSVLNNSGVIEAQSIVNKNGVIILDGGPSGAVVNSGTLDASGRSAGETGGTVKVLGDNLTLAAGTKIDVSGANGGGTALVGGNAHGQGPEQNAINTTVANGATIDADAITSGNGGQVVVWSNDATSFDGAISARGGSASGDGGSVETSSSKLTIGDNASVTTLAAHGTSGNWLLDPDGFVIAAGGGDITGLVLSKALGNGSVTIASTDGSGTGGNIDINDVVNWSAGTTLVLNATNAINVNAAITGANGDLTLTAGTDINVNAPSSLKVNTLTATADDNVNINAVQTWAYNGAWTFNGTNINVNDTVDWSNGTLTLNADAAGGFINLNAVMTASDKAKLVVTYNPDMDTSTVDYTYQSYNWLTDSMDTITDTQPSATYGTPLGGINPLFAADGKSFLGKIDFINSEAANALTINGQVYTLITSMDQLANISTVSRNADGSVATDPDTGDPLSYTLASGNYALATDLDASDKVYPGTIVWQLTGNLEGLGHVVNNLTIKPPLEANVVSPYYTEYSEDGALALIGTVGGIPGGRDYFDNTPIIVTANGSPQVRNLGVTNVSIQTAYLNSSLTVDAASGASGLVDTNYGVIINTFATGKDSPIITGSAFDGNTNVNDGYNASEAANVAISAVGASGLVGSNYGIIYGSHASVDVYSPMNSAAGLVGWNQRSYASTFKGDVLLGVILNCYATGNVYAGSNAFSTGGMVGTWNVGGFVGYNAGGVISDSYATGNVTGINASDIGGFAGGNNCGVGSEMGTLNNVGSSGTLNLAATTVYMSGSGSAGGLVGDNEGNVNGGYTSSNVVITSYTINTWGFPMKVTYDGAGAAFGNEEGTDNGVTATGSVLVDGASNYTYPSGYVVDYNNFTGGWDFGGSTNFIFNPGAGGTPPQQTATQAARQAVVQQAAAARAQAQNLTQQATAQQVAVAADHNVAAHNVAQQSAATQQTAEQAGSGPQTDMGRQARQTGGDTMRNLLDLLNPANLFQSTANDQLVYSDLGGSYSAHIKSIFANGVEYQLEDNSSSNEDNGAK